MDALKTFNILIHLNFFFTFSKSKNPCKVLVSPDEIPSNNYTWRLIRLKLDRVTHFVIYIISVRSQHLEMYVLYASGYLASIMCLN